MSHAMVMCAFTTSPETSQFIDPPPGSVIGDRVTFDGYEGVYCVNVSCTSVFVFTKVYRALIAELLMQYI